MRRSRTHCPRAGRCEARAGGDGPTSRGPRVRAGPPLRARLRSWAAPARVCGAPRPKALRLRAWAAGDRQRSWVAPVVVDDVAPARTWAARTRLMRCTLVATFALERPVTSLIDAASSP